MPVKYIYTRLCIHPVLVYVVVFLSNKHYVFCKTPVCGTMYFKFLISYSNGRLEDVYF